MTGGVRGSGGRICNKSVTLSRPLSEPARSGGVRQLSMNRPRSTDCEAIIINIGAFEAVKGRVRVLFPRQRY